ncbi:hypothetical protein RDI58_021175 [Solanum bulbocastanum]|uniref:Uncharacterized protein n=1 Tax=Solanum bulbocastanum TaxID=147425 RepID=A0AAN8T7Q4_SOLBU
MKSLIQCHSRRSF